MMWLQSLAIFLTLGAILALVLRRTFIRYACKLIRGPSTPSWIFGNVLDFNRQDQAGDLDFKWMREFGPTWRLNGILGETILMTADPKAMHHAFQKYPDDYPKPADNIEIIRMYAGPGIIWSSGHVHQRHRRIMHPMFTAPQLRTYVPIFQRNIRKMNEMWRTELAAQPSGRSTTCVYTWLTRVALDIVGEAAFDYSFGALSNDSSDLLKVYTNMFVDTALYPAAVELLIRPFWRFLPKSFLGLMDYLPLKDIQRIRQIRKAFEKEASILLKHKTDDFLSGNDINKDLMSILVRANASENPKNRLSDAEMIAQMGSITIAGHDTTATTLSWLFFELARHPQWQEKLRDEIRTFRAAAVARGDITFSLEDLDSMTYCIAALKETLRYHPVGSNVRRVAEKDDIIPLQYPILSESGELLTEVPVYAGQEVWFTFCGYNRLSQIWGDNADVWDPSRFLGRDDRKQVGVGVFASLMTFSCGPQACIGWRFSVMESQVAIAEILESFAFSLPVDEPEIQRLPSAVMNPGVMAPCVRGKLELGAQLPLQISFAE
ncbi:cytochrome P450 [Obba rivulosa]|uniref:Cytochrome P450 n=1 Tax=Obba rivulosa TaxID=1052685 RepID=A0A8E2ANP3_9APHY|nr:cytochrome P450 [Obba rivulosa]